LTLVTGGGVVLATLVAFGGIALLPDRARLIATATVAAAKELIAPRVRVTLGQQTTLEIVLTGDRLVLE
jgi:hypothetical protein